MPIDTQQEIIQDFVVETKELLESLDNNLIMLEKTPTDKQILDQIFRVAHTIKGTANFLALTNISNLTHAIEDVFNGLRKAEIRLNDKTMDILLESVDHIKLLLQDINAGRPEGSIETIVNKLKTVLSKPNQQTAEKRKYNSVASQTEAKSKKTTTNSAAEKSFSEFEKEIQAILDNSTKKIDAVDNSLPNNEFFVADVEDSELFQPDFSENLSDLLEEEDSNKTFVLSSDQESMRDDFIAETGDHLELIDSLLVKIENQSYNPNDINELFRMFHTIKGNAALMQLNYLQKMAQAGEEVLSFIRTNQTPMSAVIIDALLNSTDLIKKRVAGIQKNIEGVTQKQFQTMIDVLWKIKENLSATAPPKIPIKPNSKEGQKPKRNSTASLPTPDKVEKDLPPMPLKKESEPISKNKNSNEPPSAKSFLTENSIRVEVKRLDNLMDQVGELVTAKNRLQQVSQELSEQYGEIEKITDDLAVSSDIIDGITADIQTSIMHTRMLAIDKVFSRYPRMIRDLSKVTGKQMTLEISGEETELDKSVMELISDPLVHLVRNAVDHGLESTEERRLKGKPEKGLIHLSASQEGSHVVIKVEDDGRGVNVEAIREKIIEKKLLSAHEVENTSDKQIINYIFHPGFTTSKTAGALSGRGVGMDVVRANIEKLNGIIDIDTEWGKGTCTTLRIPLTLAITQSLLVKISEDRFAIPLSAVFETVKIKPEEVDFVHGREIYQLREEVLSLIRMQRIFSWEIKKKDYYYVVILGLGHRKFGLLVDEMIGQKEVVIKSLGNFLNGVIETKAFTGATIMGDGSITLIINVKGLMEMVYEQ